MKCQRLNLCEGWFTIEFRSYLLQPIARKQKRWIAEWKLTKDKWMLSLEFWKFLSLWKRGLLKNYPSLLFQKVRYLQMEVSRMIILKFLEDMIKLLTSTTTNCKLKNAKIQLCTTVGSIRIEVHNLSKTSNFKKRRQKIINYKSVWVLQRFFNFWNHVKRRIAIPDNLAGFIQNRFEIRSQSSYKKHRQWHCDIFCQMGPRDDWKNSQQFIFIKSLIFDKNNGDVDGRIPDGNLRKMWVWKSTKKNYLHFFSSIGHDKSYLRGKSQGIFSSRIIYKFRTVSYYLQREIQK